MSTRFLRGGAAGIWVAVVLLGAACSATKADKQASEPEVGVSAAGDGVASNPGEAIADPGPETPESGEGTPAGSPAEAAPGGRPGGSAARGSSSASSGAGGPAGGGGAAGRGGSAPAGAAAEAKGPGATPPPGAAVPTPGAPGGVDGRGVTASTIKLGIAVTANITKGCAAVGLSKATCEQISGDEESARAVVDDINRNGGIAGRKIVPVIFANEVVAGGTYSAQAQRICANFAEDQKVFAAVSNYLGGNDSLLECLSRRDTPLVETNAWLFDDDYYARYADHLYQPHRLMGSKVASTYVNGLSMMRFFDGGKLGLLRFDAPVYSRITDKVLKPALKAVSVPLVEEAIIKTPSDPSQYGAMNAELNNAILRFRASRVDRVIFLDQAGELPYFFLPAAEAQGYRPRYGFYTNSMFKLMVDNAPHGQLSGAVGVGWNPANDVQHPGDDPTLQEAGPTRCDKIHREAKLPERRWGGRVYCDALFFLKAALEKSGTLTTPGLRTGVEALGDGFPSHTTLGTRFGPGRHYGVAAAANARYLPECKCFRYEGSPYPVP